MCVGGVGVGVGGATRTRPLSCSLVVQPRALLQPPPLCLESRPSPNLRSRDLQSTPPVRLDSQDDHTSFMRLNWYPALPEGEEGLGLNQHTGALSAARLRPRAAVPKAPQRPGRRLPRLQLLDPSADSHSPHSDARPQP